MARVIPNLKIRALVPLLENSVCTLFDVEAGLLPFRGNAHRALLCSRFPSSFAPSTAQEIVSVRVSCRAARPAGPIAVKRSRTHALA
jgi:hypothetical protein